MMHQEEAGERMPFEEELEGQHGELFRLLEKVANGNRNFIAGQKSDTVAKKVIVYHFARAAYLRCDL